MSYSPLDEVQDLEDLQEDLGIKLEQVIKATNKRGEQ